MPHISLTHDIPVTV